MKKYIPYLIFAGITVLVMFPLYRPGHIFLLDMVWPPVIDLSDFLQNGVGSSFPFVLLFKLFSFILPVAVIQKIVLSLILFLPGAFMYRLARGLTLIERGRTRAATATTPTASRPPLLKKEGMNMYAVLAGVIYMINPWVYERFLAGHWLVLLGYAVFPLIIKLFLDWRSKLTLKSFTPFAVLFSIYPILSPHWAYISTIFLLTLLVVSLFNRKPQYVVPGSDRPAPLKRMRGEESRPEELGSRMGLRDDSGAGMTGMKKNVLYFLLFALFFLLVNSFWLFGFFTPESTFTGISIDDFQAFQTQSDPQFGPFVNGLSLYGFWSTDYSLPKDTVGLWWIYPFVLLGLSALGFFSLTKTKGKERTSPNPSFVRRGKILGITLAILFVPALLLGVGFAHDIGKAITTAFYQILPGFKGLRETAKIFGLLAFSYALLVPLGARVLANNLSNLPSHLPKNISRGIVLAVLGVMVFSMSHTMFFGFGGQVKPAPYPSGWYEVEKTLANDQSTEIVLFLPWHGYMAMSFAGYHNVVNPANQFFSAEIIAGKTIENVFIKETVQPDWDETMFSLLHDFESFDDNLEFFESQNISHIILAREADWDRYNFLDKSKALEKITETESISLYEIQY